MPITPSLHAMIIETNNDLLGCTADLGLFFLASFEMSLLLELGFIFD